MLSLSKIYEIEQAVRDRRIDCAALLAAIRRTTNENRFMTALSVEALISSHDAMREADRMLTNFR